MTALGRTENPNDIDLWGDCVGQGAGSGHMADVFDTVVLEPLLGPERPHESEVSGSGLVAGENVL